jgi:YHS domain-containing protein
MDGLFSLLLFAGLFYFMMRFGCGAHMVHGRGGHGGHGDRGDERAAAGSRSTDPVCGMEVAPDLGYTKMHEGRQYRLCSRACLDTFEANPQQYVAHAGGVR